MDHDHFVAHLAQLPAYPPYPDKSDVELLDAIKQRRSEIKMRKLTPTELRVIVKPNHERQYLELPAE